MATPPCPQLPLPEVTSLPSRGGVGHWASRSSSASSTRKFSTAKPCPWPSLRHGYIFCAAGSSRMMLKSTRQAAAAVNVGAKPHRPPSAPKPASSSCASYALQAKAPVTRSALVATRLVSIHPHCICGRQQAIQATCLLPAGPPGASCTRHLSQQSGECRPGQQSRRLSPQPQLQSQFPSSVAAPRSHWLMFALAKNTMPLWCV